MNEDETHGGKSFLNAQIVLEGHLQHEMLLIK
jgi:hypothetical protein